jgi:DNA-binding XRE family transcriptional regulator
LTSGLVGVNLRVPNDPARAKGTGAPGIVNEITSRSPLWSAPAPALGKRIGVRKAVSVMETMNMNPIKSYRGVHGLTLEQLGKRIGVRKATVWKYENGTTVPAEMAIKIAAETDIPLHRLRPDLWVLPVAVANDRDEASAA